MTDNQKKIVELVEKVEALSKESREVWGGLNNLLMQEGEGTLFQADDKTVYKVVVPPGTYIDYERIGYLRTRKAGETKGSLSMKEAQEAGFVVPKDGA